MTIKILDKDIDLLPNMAIYSNKTEAKWHRFTATQLVTTQRLGLCLGSLILGAMKFKMGCKFP